MTPTTIRMIALRDRPLDLVAALLVVLVLLPLLGVDCLPIEADFLAISSAFSPSGVIWQLWVEVYRQIAGSSMADIPIERRDD
jgi:hypothetical protein